MHYAVMVIDDSPLERFLAETIIKNSQFGEEVISFNSAVEGLAYLESLESDPERFPDVLFVDIQMPLMNGFQFLDKFMEFPDAIKHKCKIVMYSSTLDDKDYIRMRRYPVIRKFLTKPLSEEMLRRIDSL